MFVTRSNKVSRSFFRNLPMGGIYYDSAGTSGPFVKTTNTTKLAINSDQSPAQTTVSPTTTAVIEVDPIFIG